MREPENPKSSSVHQRLAALGIELPSALPPVAQGYRPAFVPFRRSGSQIHVSGRLAKRAGQVWGGKVGADLSLALAQQAARGIAIELLSVLHEATGDLEQVRLVKLFAMVQGAVDFIAPHEVADAASELLVAVLGEHGAHARSAISVVACPFGACVELELLAEIRA